MKEFIDKLAQTLMFELSDEENKIVENEFIYISGYVDRLKAINTDNVLPLFYPFEDETDYLRDDVVSNEYTVEEIIRNSKDAKDGFVIVPKVVK